MSTSDRPSLPPIHSGGWSPFDHPKCQEASIRPLLLLLLPLPFPSSSSLSSSTPETLNSYLREGPAQAVDPVVFATACTCVPVSCGLPPVVELAMTSSASLQVAQAIVAQAMLAQGVVCKQRGLFASLILPIGCRSLVVPPFFFLGQCARAHNFRLCRCSLSWWRVSPPCSLVPQRWDARIETLRIHRISATVLSLRGHCSAEAPESGIDGTAVNTAECKRGGFQMEPKPLETAEPASGSSAHPARVTVLNSSVRDSSAKVTALK